MTGRSIANAPSYFTMLGKQLTGWTAKRRVVVLRRKQQRRMEKESSHELGWPLLAEGDPVPEYEYQVLVTNLSEELLRLRARPSPPSPRKIAVGSFYTPDTLRGLWKHSNDGIPLGRYSKTQLSVPINHKASANNIKIRAKHVSAASGVNHLQTPRMGWKTSTLATADN